MNIAGRSIDALSPPYVIAEIGVNHDGDPARALELTEAAARAGADAVKVQFFKAELLLSTDAGLAEYQKNTGETDPHAMLKRLELGIEALAGVARLARELNVHSICTVFTPELVAEAEAASFDAYKSASPDLINRLLIERLAATERPLILSTGTCTIEEIARTLAWVPGTNDRLALMHCVSAYPTPDADATLGAVRALRERFVLPIGYSDHTAGTYTGALAVCAGACILEKHLTHCRSASGPDHAASLEPSEFAEYVNLARRAFTMLGSTNKAPREIEENVRSLSRQSLAVHTPLPAGTVITTAHLTTARPAIGLPASAPEVVLGKRTVRDLSPGHLLRESDLA